MFRIIRNLTPSLICQRITLSLLFRGSVLSPYPNIVAHFAAQKIARPLYEKHFGFTSNFAEQDIDQRNGSYPYNKFLGMGVERIEKKSFDRSTKV